MFIKNTISFFRTLRLLCVAATVVVFYAASCGTSETIRTQTSASSPTEESIRFTNGDISLAGTLVLPAGPQKHPAVVLFHGSGPQPRILTMARWFASQGFAALTYDKRGVGESTGNFRVVPFMQLCDDGLAAIAYLKLRKEINSNHIGVWGLSQGGWLGPLAASRSTEVAFVIAVSGPAVSPGEQMLFYYAKDLEAKGLPESDIREATALRSDIWNYQYIGNGYEEVESQIKRARSKSWFATVKTQQDNLFEGIHPPSANNEKSATKFNWFKQEMNYDPVPTLEALRVPALFLYGTEDRLVPVPKSVDVIRNVLSRDSTKDFTITVLPNDDHGMYLPSGNLDPNYLEAMRTWPAAQSKAWH
jgi:dienelactone hydrolase